VATLSDTLATLQQALRPKTGMQRIPFPTEIYEHPSLPLSAKKLLNLMVEQAPKDARTETPLVSTPGLLPYIVVGSGPILAMNDEMPGTIYVVSGTKFYRVTFTAGTLRTEATPLTTPIVTLLGDVGTADAGTSPWNSFCTIAAGPTACVVCVAPRAYTCTHTGTLNQITDPDFPGASSVCYVDGYFAFSSLGDTAQWFISRLLDPSSFDALDFVFSDAMPNVIRRVVSHREQVWTIGENGFEVWYNAGSSGLETTPGVSFFPFRRMAGGVVPIGTGSPLAVCKADQSLFWMGLDGIVYRSNGYTPKRISTHAIEAIIAGASVSLDAVTHAYRGHWFYCLTTLDHRTLVYDVATDKWHERSTSTDGIGPWKAWMAATDNNSLHLFGDRVSGQLYTLGMQAADAGVIVIRQAVLPPLWAGTKRAFCSRIEIEMEVGGASVAGPVTLDWSDDGSRTWKPARTLAAGIIGDTRKRVFTTRLGSFRQRTFRLSVHGLCRFYAMDADISPGND
jgi:hypothetical protein